MHIYMKILLWMFNSQDSTWMMCGSLAVECHAVWLVIVLGKQIKLQDKW